MRSVQGRERRRRAPVWGVFVALGLLGACGGGGGGPDPRPPGPPLVDVHGRALLIGVSEYRSPTLKDLRGPANDVRLMRDVLVRRFGFRPEDVRLLEDEEATYNGIVTAIRQLLASVTEDEMALIYFSGHGSQVRDEADGDESDGFDETIVPHDARVSRIPDLTDDMLASELAFHEKPAVVILDSCYSGSGTRLGVVARAAERDLRSGTDEIYAEQRALAASRGSVADLDHDALVRTVELQRPHLLLAAASDRQQAIEGDIGSTRHGLFTFALASALSKAREGISIAELMRGPVTRELLRLNEELKLDDLPNPQLEGPAEYRSQSLFRHAQQARLTSSPVRSAGDGRLRVEAGATMPSAQPGAVLGLYPPDAPAFRATEMSAYAVVEGRDGPALVARPGTQASVPGASRAVLLQPAPPGAVRIHLADEEAETRLAELAGALAGVAELVDAPPTAGFVVSRGSADTGSTGWDVARADGIPVAFVTGDDAEAVRDLAGYVRYASEVDALRSLDNLATPLGLDLWVEQVEPPPGGLSSRGIDFLGLDVPVYTEVRERVRMRAGQPVLDEAGQPVLEDVDPPTRRNCVHMALSANAPCHVTVLEVDAAGSVAQLWPLGDEDMAALGLDAGGNPTGDWPLRVPPLPARPGDRPLFRIRCGPPHGLTTLVAVATTDPGLAAEIRALVAEHGASGARSLRPAVVELHATLAGRALAGVDWDVESVTYRVDPVRE